MVEWYAERLEDENGDIFYEAHGPKDSFIVFMGPNAKADCALFINMVGGSMPA